MPKLSVIVPVYNTEKYLRECVDSILAQIFTDFELILVNDGSTDSSGAICDEYAKKDGRIHVIHQKNLGATVARRNGVSQACGEYIAFVDSDDWISQNMYQDMLHKAEASGADIVLCDMVLEKQTGHTVVQSSSFSGFFAKDQLQQKIYGALLFIYAENKPGLSLSLCNKLIKAPLIKSALALLPNEITYGEDAIGSLICMLESTCIYIMKGFAGYHYRHSAEFVVRERSLSLLPCLSSFARIMQIYLAKYGFIDDQLAGYMAQVSLYCIRQILLFNTNHTMREKLCAVKHYMQETHIQKLFMQAEKLIVDWKMRLKLKLINRGHYFLLLILFTVREMIMRLQRYL